MYRQACPSSSPLFFFTPLFLLDRLASFHIVCLHLCVSVWLYPSLFSTFTNSFSSRPVIDSHPPYEPLMSWSNCQTCWRETENNDRVGLGLTRPWSSPSTILYDFVTGWTVKEAKSQDGTDSSLTVVVRWHFLFGIWSTRVSFPSWLSVLQHWHWTASRILSKRLLAFLRMKYRWIQLHVFHCRFIDYCDRVEAEKLELWWISNQNMKGQDGEQTHAWKRETRFIDSFTACSALGWF